jgi:hypothetical protein
MSIAHLARKVDVYIIPPHSSSSRGHELGFLLLKKIAMRVVFTTGFLLRNNIDGNNYYRNDFRTICICNEFLKNKRTE